MMHAPQDLPIATRLRWGAAVRPLPGESESGDQYVAMTFPDGALLAAVDGVGHGAEAAAAARAAVAVLQARPHEGVISLLRRCHEALGETRGVVMSLASFSRQDGTLTWMGVGNVEGLLLRSDPSASPALETLLLRGGVVGYQLPQLRASVMPVMPGDLLVFATDGIRSAFSGQLPPLGHPQDVADRILAQWSRDTDDALVLVVEFLGEKEP